MCSKFGKEYIFFHPILCRLSVSEKKCLNKSWTYIHFKSTNRAESTMYDSRPREKNENSLFIDKSPAKNGQLEWVEKMLRGHEERLRPRDSS